MVYLRRDFRLGYPAFVNERAKNRTQTTQNTQISQNSGISTNRGRPNVHTARSRVITPQPTLEGAGVKLKRSIATQTLDYLDPFLFWDHFGSDNPADYLPGFPLHPHRGIETVTYMLAG